MQPQRLSDIYRPWYAQFLKSPTKFWATPRKVKSLVFVEISNLKQGERGETPPVFLIICFTVVFLCTWHLNWRQGRVSTLYYLGTLLALSLFPPVFSQNKTAPGSSNKDGVWGILNFVRAREDLSEETRILRRRHYQTIYWYFSSYSLFVWVTEC